MALTSRRTARRTGKALAVLLGVVFAMILAACSSGTGGSAAGGSSSAAAGSTIVLGTICTCSGPLSSTFGPSKQILDAWASWVNANGGINGQKVSFDLLDDQDSASVGLSDAQTLIQADHVLAIVGPQGLSSSGWAKYADQQGVPVIGSGGATVGWENPDQNFTDPNFYPAGSAGAAAAYLLDQAAKDVGATTYGVVYCSESPTCASVTPTARADALKWGLKFGKGVAVSATAPNYTAPCLTLKQAGVDAVDMAIATTTVQALVPECAQQGYQPYILGSSATVLPYWASNPAFAKAAGEADEFPWWDESLPGVKTFRQVMAKYDPAAMQTPALAAEEWAAAMIFDHAATLAKLTPHTTSAQLKTALDSFNGVSLGGVLPDITYANGNRNQPCGWLFNVVNGQFHTLNGGKLYCPAAS